MPRKKKEKRVRTTILKVLVENYRRLRVAEVVLDGEAGLVRVTGENEAGKSSLLKSIAAAMGGAGEVGEDPIHEGSERANIRLVLSNGWSIVRRFTLQAPKGYLTITKPDGKTSTKQGELKEILGPHSFDPMALLTLDLEKQRKVLLDCGNDPELTLKLDTLKHQQKRVYEERTPHISEQRKAKAIPEPEGLRPEVPDVSGKMGELRALQVQVDERQDLIHMVDRKRESLGNLLQTIEDGEARITRLKAQLEQAQAGLAQSQDNFQEQQGMLKSMESQLESIADPSEDMEQLRLEISQADEVQEQLEVWRTWDRAQDQHREATAEVDRLTAKLKKMREKEGQLIAAAEIPVKGLSFDEGGQPLLKGRHFSSASGGEKIKAAVQVAMAENPEVGVCLVDEANDLDLKRMAILEEEAKEWGFQIWACRLGLEGDGEIVVDDGVAMNRKEVA